MGGCLRLKYCRSGLSDRRDLKAGETLDELASLRDSHIKAREGAETVGLVVAPSMACNMACPYCFEHNKKGKMSRETANALLDFIRGRADLIAGQTEINFIRREKEDDQQQCPSAAELVLDHHLFCALGRVVGGCGAACHLVRFLVV